MPAHISAAAAHSTAPPSYPHPTPRPPLLAQLAPWMDKGAAWYAFHTREGMPTEGGPREYRILDYAHFKNKFDADEQATMAKEEARAVTQLPAPPLPRAR